MKKQCEEILAEIYRNAQLALQSISNLMPEVDDALAREELSRQHEEYEKFSSRALVIAKNKGIELKEPNPLKKAMMWGSIKMSAMKDNSLAHVADMMLQGTIMGITALRSSQNMAKPDEDEEVLALLDEMLQAEERFEKTWKEYL